MFRRVLIGLVAMGMLAFSASEAEAARRTRGGKGAKVFLVKRLR